MTDGIFRSVSGFLRASMTFRHGVRPSFRVATYMSSTSMKTFSNVRSRGRIRIQCSGVFFGPARLKRVKRTLITGRNSTKKGEMMKKMLLSIALAIVTSLAWGQTLRQPLMKQEQVPQQPPPRNTTTTTTTTAGSGTITEYAPGSAIVLRESSGPVRYRFGKTVTYVTRSGRVLDENTVRTRIRVGVPVRVHYVGTGENRVVDRVILEKD